MQPERIHLFSGDPTPLTTPLAPAAATATSAFGNSNELTVTAPAVGNQYNGATLVLVDPQTELAVLSASLDRREVTVNLATNAGDRAVATLPCGTASIAVLPIAGGAAGNVVDGLVVVIAETASHALGAAAAGGVITLTLGTDGDSLADDAKNTATLITAALDGLAGYTATLTGSGAQVRSTAASLDFTGGGENIAVTTTVDELPALVNAIDGVSDLFELTTEDTAAAEAGTIELAGGVGGIVLRRGECVLDADYIYFAAQDTTADSSANLRKIAHVAAF